MLIIFSPNIALIIKSNKMVIELRRFLYVFKAIIFKGLKYKFVNL